MTLSFLTKTVSGRKVLSYAYMGPFATRFLDNGSMVWYGSPLGQKRRGNVVTSGGESAEWCVGSNPLLPYENFHPHYGNIGMWSAKYIAWLYILMRSIIAQSYYDSLWDEGISNSKLPGLFSSNSSFQRDPSDRLLLVLIQGYIQGLHIRSLVPISFNSGRVTMILQ